ncbi:hypothetical protein O3M35_013079 [Rhynocoris fuscipes]|uniref:Uncharacterized protein n=1 Tax=Rhynocoris fuscipes TaxID=488301 RepID=A0AAW1CET4_9HEMI
MGVQDRIAKIRNKKGVQARVTEADQRIAFCICNRLPANRIHCLECKNVIKKKGRVRKRCRVHPNTIFLLDLSQCPLCGAPAIYLQESPEPHGNHTVETSYMVTERIHR